MTLEPLVPALAVALLLAGCGGSSGADSTTAKTSGDVVTVDMSNIQFDPKTVTVKLGQTVKWVNEDQVVHDVKADSGATFSSDLFGHGKSYAFKPTKAGTIAYECTVHPGMTGTLKVTG